MLPLSAKCSKNRLAGICVTFFLYGIRGSSYRVAVMKRATKTRPPAPPKSRFKGANQTMLIAVAASFVIHAAVIYGVPSVIVFSDGTARPSEPIVVDVLNAQELAALSDLPPTAENEFAAEIPSPLLERTPADMAAELAALERPATLDEAVTLLARAETAEMPLPDPAKRPPDTPPMPERALPESLPMAAPLTFAPLLRQPGELAIAAPAPMPKKPMELLDQKPLPSASRIAEADAAQSRLSLAGMPKALDSDQNRFGVFAGPRYEEAVNKQDEADIPKKEERRVKDEVTPAPAFSPEKHIEGPAKGRSVAYRPRPPQANISIDVELRFKFWVLPDGAIGEVIPVKRGNAKLEQLAMAYLKQWRFEPLPANAPQVKVWGTIPIKFIAQ